MQQLFLVMRALAPDNEWRWLWLTSRRLAKFEKPRHPPPMDGQELFGAGVARMRRALIAAEDSGYVSERAAKMCRKGLEVAFSAILPDRNRAKLALRLGKTIFKRGEQWIVQLPAEYQKNKKPLPHRLPPELCRWVTIYVDVFRPAIPGAATHNGFWATMHGTPMTNSTMYQSITRTTAEDLGRPVCPQEFRRAVASKWHDMSPSEPDKPRRHLTHASYRTTQDHYIIPSGEPNDLLSNAFSLRRKVRGGERRAPAAERKQRGRKTATTRRGAVRRRRAKRVLDAKAK